MAVILLLTLAFKVAEWSGVSYEAVPVATPSVDTPTAETGPVRTPGDWRQELIALGIIATTTPATATSSDPVAYVGDILANEMLRGYAALKENDAYTVDAARSLGSSLGTNVLPVSTAEHISLSDISIDADTSRERVLRYRADMREGTAPLISDAPPEIELFAEFLETGNREKLRALETAAARYEQAAENLGAIQVPEDAAQYHVRAVNALKDYGNTLQRLVLFSEQPLPALALLRTYNEAERELLFAFDVLAQYYVRKSSE